MASSDVSNPIGRLHRTRLMQLWRSAGWPCRDALEIDLLAAGLLRLSMDAQGRETLHLTEAGIACLAQSRQRNLRSLGAHDRLAGRMARHLMDTGRIVWRELTLRALVEGPAWPPAQPEGPLMACMAQDVDPAAPAASVAQAKAVWRLARPDVFSVRNTSVEAYLQPLVHEVKVSRADLLSDLRHAAKRQSYQWLCCEAYYVFPAHIARPDEIPEAFGVWLLHGDVDDGRLELARPARHVSCQLPFAVWLALAKATPLRPEFDDEVQAALGSGGQPAPGGRPEGGDPDADQPGARPAGAEVSDADPRHAANGADTPLPAGSP